MTGLLGTAYSVNQASYDLARLSRNGLLTRIAHRNLYALTPDGLRCALFPLVIARWPESVSHWSAGAATVRVTGR